MAKAVMIQGTMSGAGKSLLTAGLCRIFHQDGYRAAPFKSQNMALNSYITKEGLEMGRAQVMQALAAGIEPLVCMNPILLKPTDDVGSQVIVEGKVWGNMSAKEYFACKKELIPQILSSYHKLEEIADIIVIEGAGSPAEINLKQNDIVNMGLAELLDVPVLLAGDIDRGGVFAQLYGTVMLLEPQERERIFGLIINKFRGDKSILQPGIDMLEEKIKIPVAGVIPYLHVDIEEEDSLSSRLSNKNRKKKAIDLAVIRLPRISNYTDFSAFEAMPEVSVRYISTVSEIKDADMVILPGTKNTISDLKWLRQQGLEGAIKQLAAAGKVIFGICGGFQMLGKKISDPDSVEGKGELAGIGLLDMDTCFGQEKIRARVTGEILNIEGSLKTVSLASFTGYEIHMGQSVLEPGVRPFCMVRDEISGKKWAEGGCNKNVYGTYVHGIFDEADIRKQIVMALGKAKGMELSDIAPIDYAEYQQIQYDKLADGIRQNIDLDMIYGRLR